MTRFAAALLLSLAACSGGGECEDIGSTKGCDEGYVCADAGLLGPEMCQRICHTDDDCDTDQDEYCAPVSQDSEHYVCTEPQFSFGED